jgi:hypothetical protein
LQLYFLYFCDQIRKAMKKVLAIVFLGSLVAVSCSKKDDKSLQDSNIMLEEPATPIVVDSTATKTDSTPAPAATPAPATDSTAAK